VNVVRRTICPAGPTFCPLSGDNVGSRAVRRSRATFSPRPLTFVGASV